MNSTHFYNKSLKIQLIALNLQTSFLTPPMAMSAYYLKGVQKMNVELIEIFRGIMPFLLIVILSMVILYNFPGLALWLPEKFFGSFELSITIGRALMVFTF